MPVDRMPAFVGAVTLVAGLALVGAPGLATRRLGLDGQEAAVRAIGVSDLVLVPGLLRGSPRWPWMAGRAALNLAQAAYLLQAPSRAARAAAGALVALTAVDGGTALALRPR